MSVSVIAGAALSAFFNVLFDRLSGRCDLLHRRRRRLQLRLELLETKLREMLDVLDRIDSLNRPSDAMNDWAKIAKDVVCSIDVLLADLMSKSARRYFSDIFLEFQFRQKVNSYVLSINDLLDRNDFFDIEGSNSLTQRSIQYSKETVVIGLEEQVNEITERLLSLDELHRGRCVFFIVGMEGSGKTFLAKSIYANNAAHFHTHAWVSISQERSAEDILQDIMEKVIGSDHQELKGKQSLKEELKQMLQNFLREKRYLIVLDKIPMSGVWDDLKDAFPDQSNGSRIMITTRDMDSPLDADSGIFHYKMQLLSTDESWRLFKNTLLMDIPEELEEVGRTIVICCRGLPLTIKKMGELLSDKEATKEEWTRVLNMLKEDPGPWSEISYKVLGESPLDLKRCLQYFLLFPEEFEIPARRIIRLWVAEGYLFKLKRTEEFSDISNEEVAENSLMKLIDLNFVQVTKKKQNGKVRSCRLPFALRRDSSFERLVNTASESSSGLQEKVWVFDHYNSTEPSETSSHIHGDNTDNSTLQASYEKSLSFLSFDFREGSQAGEEIGNFLDRCISCRCFLWLRVLDLERVFRPQLPKVLSKLVSMRYLGLRWTYLESFPSSISNLLQLQTLDVKHTYISSLPQSIWKMQRLRHLYLSESYRSRFGPPPRGASLKDLQTLWGVFVDEKSPVKDGLDTLINLRKFGVACRCMSTKEDANNAMSLQLEAVAEWIQKLKRTLQSLRLKSHDENNQPWDLHLQSLLGHTNLSSIYLLGRLKTPSVISVFPDNLIEITLSASALSESEDPMQKFNKLPKLRILQLFSKSYMGKNMCCPKDSFPQLRVLKLWKLEELEDWIVLGGALPRLRDLDIRSCAKLHKLPDCPKDSFPQLQVLKLWKLEELEDWIVLGGGLPRLRDLEIRSCAKLHKLPDGLQHVTTLRELKLSNMPGEFTEQIKDRNSEDWGKLAHVRHVSIEP
ncbi:disease resistance protein RPP13-like [Quercus suber]|uniref:Disease resistance protein rpm1 n=1 Tax=Quercus suber TaxID=58331 RepID=A0AAW0KH39_QUESU|nr:disease resistance protein RPP13-like [Quercus suber]XP_023916818.1 disease resistance protein RPP13-like [Quercus suber]